MSFLRNGIHLTVLNQIACLYLACKLQICVYALRKFRKHCSLSLRVANFNAVYYSGDGLVFSCEHPVTGRQNLADFARRRTAVTSMAQLRFNLTKFCTSQSPSVKTDRNQGFDSALKSNAAAQWVMRGWSLISLIIRSVYLGRRRLFELWTFQPAYYPSGHAIQLFESYRSRISFVRSNPWSIQFRFNRICDTRFNRYELQS